MEEDEPGPVFSHLDIWTVLSGIHCIPSRTSIVLWVGSLMLETFLFSTTPIVIKHVVLLQELLPSLTAHVALGDCDVTGAGRTSLQSLLILESEAGHWSLQTQSLSASWPFVPSAGLLYRWHWLSSLHGKIGTDDHDV